jgi:DNA-binding Lrp family transcriptional regulator
VSNELDELREELRSLTVEQLADAMGIEPWRVYEMVKKARKDPTLVRSHLYSDEREEKGTGRGRCCSGRREASEGNCIARSEDPVATAREIAVIRLLSNEVPKRRLLAATAADARLRPYCHPSLSDLPLTEGGLVRLTEFRYNGAVLERNGFCFLPFPATPGPNSGYWLLQHLAKEDLRESVSLRLDPFMHGPRDKFPCLQYKMYLFGQPLDWDRIASLREPEFGRWKADRWTPCDSSTEFVWQPRGNEVHFICEELPASGSESIRGARYLHAVYEPQRRLITHLDGALRIYSAPELASRVTKHVKDVGKVGRRIKLFRTDTPIPRDRFADIATSFYVWNNDVTEYFCPRAALRAARSIARLNRRTEV